jgi:hypothetical protein
MGLQVKRVRISEQAREPVCDLFAVFFIDTDIDFHAQVHIEV